MAKQSRRIIRGFDVSEKGCPFSSEEEWLRKLVGSFSLYLLVSFAFALSASVGSSSFASTVEASGNFLVFVLFHSFPILSPCHLLYLSSHFIVFSNLLGSKISKMMQQNSNLLTTCTDFSQKQICLSASFLLSSPSLSLSHLPPSWQQGYDFQDFAKWQGACHVRATKSYSSIPWVKCWEWTPHAWILPAY